MFFLGNFFKNFKASSAGHSWPSHWLKKLMLAYGKICPEIINFLFVCPEKNKILLRKIICPIFWKIWLINTFQAFELKRRNKFLPLIDFPSTKIRQMISDVTDDVYSRQLEYKLFFICCQLRHIEMFVWHNDKLDLTALHVQFPWRWIPYLFYIRFQMDPDWHDKLGLQYLTSGGITLMWNPKRKRCRTVATDLYLILSKCSLNSERHLSFPKTFSLNSLISVTKIFAITVKGLEPATSCATSGCYHSTIKTHVRDRIFEFNPIYASVIY